MARMQVLSNQMAHFSSPGLIPDAPFKKTWHELAMKRMLRYAVENGYDKIAWTNGDQQADRYDLSKHVDKITWHSNQQAKPGMKNVLIHMPDGLHGFWINPEGKITSDISGEFEGKEMSDVIGKDISQKILDSEEGELSGAGLKIGGAGMKGFYDKILPDFMNKYTKKWGGRVGSTGIATSEFNINDPKYGIDSWRVFDDKGEMIFGHNSEKATKDFVEGKEGLEVFKPGEPAIPRIKTPVHSLEITPSMRESVMGTGQALFDKGSDYGGKPPAKPPLATGGFHDPNEDPRNRKITPYEQNRLLTKGSTKREIGRMARSAREQAEKMLTPISSVLRSIHPSLRSALRKNAFLQGMATAADQKAVSPFIAKARELPHNDRSDLDLALKNSDMAVIKDIIQRNNMTTEYLAARRVLDDLHKRASDMGYDIGFLKNYWPRLILDKQGFLEAMKMDTKWADIESLIQQKEDELRRVLTDDERVALINTYLRGYAQGVIGLSETPNMKTREFDEVTPVMNRFYRDSMDAVLRYISETNHAIEARRFFGTKGREFYLDDLDVSIGEYVLRLLKADVVKTDDERRLKNVLTAYFKQESMNGFLAAYKDFTVITTLGNFVSALTQLQDLGFTVYRAPSKMFMALARALTGKSQITLPELGLEVVAEELKDARKTAMWAGKVLGLAGLSKMDRITAETHINAIISKYQDQAQKPNPEFIERMRDTFGERAPEVINQLKEKKLTDDIKFLAFCEILDVQPKALSEMPENYLRGGNARIFYALKTFQLRQIDAFRVEALHKMNQPGKKNKIIGLRRLILMAMSLLLAGMGTDKLKDYVLGRKTSLSDLVTDNLLKLVGFSKWTIYKAKTEGIGSAALKSILPPMPFIDQLWKDIQTAGDKRGTQIVQSIPIVGKFYYWWMGQGALRRPVSDDAAWVRDTARQYNLNGRKEYQALVMYSHRARLAPTAAERDDARQHALQLATRIRTSWEPNLKHLDQRRQKLDERHQKKVDLGYALK